jgi:hypothetical protein
MQRSIAPRCRERQARTLNQKHAHQRKPLSVRGALATGQIGREKREAQRGVPTECCVEPLWCHIIVACGYKYELGAARQCLK